MHTVASIVTAILIITGIAGSVIPFLPGESLILLGSIIYGIGFGFDRIGIAIYITLVIIALFSSIVNYIATSIGAKKFGASKFGIIGAVIGAFLGFIVGNFPGLFIGPFLGAFAGELLKAKGIDRGLRAGFGAVIGFFAGSLVRFLLALTMTGLIIYGIVR